MKNCIVIFSLAGLGIRVMVSPAVSDDVIAPGKGLQLGLPGTVVVEASVDQDEGTALALLYIVEFSTYSTY